MIHNKEVSMRRIMRLAIVAFLVFFMLGPAGAQGKPKEVLFWNGYTGPDRPAVENLVAKFNESNADVKIKMEIMPWDSLYQKLLPALIAGNGPDIIGFSAGRVPEYAAAGKLEALDDYFKNSSLKRDVLVSGLMQAGTYKGKLYAVPMAFASMVMYYNKDHFKAAGLDPENPPKTLTELSAAWKKLLKVDAAGNVIQYPQAIGIKATVPMIPVFIWNHGADIVTADGKSGLSDPRAIEAMKFLQNAFVKDKVSPVGLTGQEADNLFAAGKASIEWNGPWAINGFRGAGINLGIAEVPAGPAGRITWSGDTVLVISKDSKQKESAWKFLEYWNSIAAQKYWATTVAFPPTRLDMGNNPDLAKNKDLFYFLKAGAYAKSYLPAQTKAGRIEEEILVPMYESIFRNLETVESAMKKADTQLTKLLSEK
jgi:multiple sugar transport system substrate-binding protein